MTRARDGRAEWEEAQLIRGNGTIERPVNDRWTVPPEIRLDHDRLVWSYRPGASAVEVRSGPGMLDGFRRLGNAAPEKILAYAGRWGVLGICEHGLPASHRPLRLTDPAMPTCEPLHLPAGDYDEHYDPLSGWHFLASATQALLNIAARLHNGNVGQAEDWRAVYANSPAMPGGWPDFWDRRPRSRDVDIMELCNRVDDWLEMGNVRPTLSRLAWLDKGAPELEFGSTWRDGALFGALALQLALAIGRVDGLAVCTACRVTYIPRRRCNPSRHNFCPECGVRASWRLAQDKRRRQ